jgi:hypothetical protein
MALTNTTEHQQNEKNEPIWDSGFGIWDFIRGYDGHSRGVLG